MSVGKTVRFAALVAAAGKPEIVTLWVPPEKNPDFIKAVEENRILSVFQPAVGAKKDFGMIGFIRKRQVSYLIFPKPLPYAEGTKAVGIRYELIEKPPAEKRMRPAAAGSAAKPSARFKPVLALPTSPPKANRFRVAVRISALMDVSVEVEADDQTAACEKALAQAKENADFKNAILSARVVKMENVS